jgi:hypothetical protein
MHRPAPTKPAHPLQGPNRVGHKHVQRGAFINAGLFANQQLRDTAIEIELERVARLQQAHARAYQRNSGQISLYPDFRRAQAARLAHRSTNSLGHLSSDRLETAAADLAALNVDPANAMVITRDQFRHAKPDPDLFLAAADRLGFPSTGRLWSGTAFEICSRQRTAGPWRWDCSAADTVPMNTAGRRHLRLTRDPGDLLDHIDGVGGRSESAAWPFAFPGSDYSACRRRRFAEAISCSTKIAEIARHAVVLPPRESPQLCVLPIPTSAGGQPLELPQKLMTVMAASASSPKMVSSNVKH